MRWPLECTAYEHARQIRKAAQGRDVSVLRQALEDATRLGGSRYTAYVVNIGNSSGKVRRAAAAGPGP